MELLGNFLLSIIALIEGVFVPVIFVVAFLIFLWGVFRFFIAGAADKEKRDEGKKFIIWSVIGFFLMFSIWGVVNLFLTTLGFNQGTRPMLPVLGGQPVGTPTVQGQGWGQAWGSGWFGGNGNGVQGGGEVGGRLECSVLNAWNCPQDGYMCRNNKCVPRPPRD